MLGIPRAILSIVLAVVVVLFAIFLPIPPPLVIGLIVAGLIIAGIVWLIG